MVWSPVQAKKGYYSFMHPSIFSYERQSETASAARDKSQGRDMEDPLQSLGFFLIL